MATVREMCRRARDRAGAPVRGLTLRRYPAPTPSEEQVLRNLLHLAANTITPSAAALERIRTRIGGAPRPGDAAATDDHLGSETPMSIIPKPARAVVPGDTITRHPDHPERKVRYRVIAGARPVGDEVLIDYTAPADEVDGMTPNDRAGGVLMLGANQPCEVETAPRSERTHP